MARLVGWRLFCNGVVLLIVTQFLGICDAKIKNACPTYGDYKTMKTNPRCWYDFRADLDFPGIVRMEGYECEKYTVQTEDGFILGLFKIPGREGNNSVRKNFPVYFHHGVLGSSSNFVNLGHDSLAFMLADAGHDVWLGNSRGNEYSEKHVNLSTWDDEFWDHTLDDITQYDLPAVFKHILKKSPSGGKIIFIGHSMANSIALMYSSKYPEEAKHQLKFMIFMCPAYTLTHIKSPNEVLLAPFRKPILATIQWMGLMRVFSQTAFMKEFGRIICLERPRMIEFCVNTWNIFYGFRSRMRPEMAAIHSHQAPSGTSLKVYTHIRDSMFGTFRHYDHGYKENMRRYGTGKPPDYDIKKIKIPIYMVYSIHDWISTEKDSKNLYNKLPRVARYGIRKITAKNFNHIDFIFAKEAKTIVYDDLMNVIKDILPKGEMQNERYS